MPRPERLRSEKEAASPHNAATRGAAVRGATARFAVVYFLLFAIYGVATPYLQLLVRGLGYGPALVGFLLGLFEITGSLGPIFIGRLSDRRADKRPLLAALAGLVVLALVPLALVPRFLVSALSLSLLALGLRSLVPLMDASAVAFAEASGRSDYGKLRSVGTAGFVAVVLALGLVPGFDRSPPWAIALAMGTSATIAGLGILIMPGSGTAAPKAGAAGSTTRRLVDPVFAIGLGVIALSRIAMAPVSSFLSLYVTEELRWDAVGFVWALAACAEIPFLILSRRFIDRMGPMRVIALSSAAIAARLGIYALFPSPAGVVVAQLLHSLCYGLFQPAAVAFVALRVPPERRATGFAAYMCFGVGLPTFVGSSLGGLLVESFGYRLLFGSYVLFALGAVGLYAAMRRRLER
jgi:PPP family 3-phenylpropionic acid transporter